MKKDANQALWTDIQLSGLSSLDLNARRNESIKRYHDREEEKYKEVQLKKRDQDQHVLHQQMKVDDNQRKFIKHETKKVLDEERKVLVDDMQKLEQQHNALTNQKKTVVQKQAFREQLKESIFDDDEEMEEIYTPGTIDSKPVDTKFKQPVQMQQIQEDEDEQDVEMPNVRKQQDVKLGFTEKKYAHLPARESHLKEPPYPKSKNLDKKKDDTFIAAEDKDPVWLKDKGDHFFKRSDYHAAINAYSKAI